MLLKQETPEVNKLYCEGQEDTHMEYSEDFQKLLKLEFNPLEEKIFFIFLLENFRRGNMTASRPENDYEAMGEVWGNSYLITNWP